MAQAELLLMSEKAINLMSKAIREQRSNSKVASEVEGLAQVSKQSQLVEILVKIFRARPLTRLLCSLTHLSLLYSLTLLLLKCMRA